jgi:hypothetical protein
MSLEELHVEGAFDLVQKSGSGRLRKAGRYGSSRQVTFFGKLNEQCELTRLQVSADE